MEQLSMGGYVEGGTILDSRLSLINYAKVKLDEVIPEGEGVKFSEESSPNISDPLNIMINSLLDEAAKRVLLNAPIHVLDPVKSAETTGTQIANDNDVGYIKLADNFLRLVSLKMNDWNREVTQAITTADRRYSVQRNKYTRGRTQKPVAVFMTKTIGGEQKRVIEYYSVDGSHAIEYLYYIQETKAEDVQSNLVDALTWVVAGMVLQIIEREDLAKLAFAQEQLCYENL